MSATWPRERRPLTTNKGRESAVYTSPSIVGDILLKKVDNFKFLRGHEWVCCLFGGREVQEDSSTPLTYIVAFYSRKHLGKRAG